MTDKTSGDLMNTREPRQTTNTTSSEHPAAQAMPTNRGAYDAVIFDLDGVVTDTAATHSLAWKTLFDELLPDLSPHPQAPFDPDADYRHYIDGRLRENGIRAFLSSRGVTLPESNPESTNGPSVASLATLKQAIFDQLLDRAGAHALPSTVAILRELRERGVATATVTSSRNSVRVLESAGVTHCFDVSVNGLDSAQLRLDDRPAPDLYLVAAKRLGVEPARTVVIEDAEAGVQAAVGGGFGLVIGLDRFGYGDHLRAAGADLVVADLGDLDLGDLEFGELNLSAHRVHDFPDWAGGDAGSDPWLLRFNAFDPALQGQREALTTLGNGYWGTRGAAAEAEADSVHYPGTYLAGVYNRVRTDLGTHVIETEHLVNAPNWLPLWFKVADGDWFRLDSPELIDYRQELDLRRGLLSRTLRVRDSSGRTTRVASRRFISQAHPHVAVLETTFTAEDWSGTLTVQSALDGRVKNSNVAADRMLSDVHLMPRTVAEIDAETILLEAETTQSGVHIALVARTRVYLAEQLIHPHRRLLRDRAGRVGHEFTLQLEHGSPIRVEKAVIVATSRDRAILSPRAAVTTWMKRLADTAALLAAHEREWQTHWAEFAVHLHSTERASLALNLNTFHVLQTLAAVDADLDAGMPARGLHGEGYHGHVFWDELFVYPALTLRRPDLSRTLLGYRYRRLNEARAAARTAGFDGAMFPWQSGIDGSDVTPFELLNTRNGQWMPDNSRLQRHVGLAVAYSVWQYYLATGDMEFLISQGAELLLEVARFFASLTTYDAVADRYDIEGTMGPDEFHDGPPDAAGEGLRNNAYTNIMTAWVLRRAAEVVTLLDGQYASQLWNRIGLQPDEVARWEHMSRRMRVLFHDDGVISQFEGYEKLPELDWDAYRGRYGSIGRLDLILGAEGDSTNNYRVSKQADVLMLLYLFSAEELRELLHDMGYALPPEAVVRMVEFYGSRCTFGSTLSNVVHSWLEARRDREKSWTYLTKALESDLADIQGGSTREGIHLGAMAGSLDMLVRCYTGIEFRADKLWLHPVLPSELTELTFSINYRGQPIRLEVSATELRLRLHSGGSTPITVMVEGQEATLGPGESRAFPLAHAGLTTVVPATRIRN